MKKKLFLKFFVLAVIGSLLTFTSCKDYDDDISRLDTDLAAAESSLTAAVSELNTLKTQIAAAATDSEVAAAVAAAKTEAIASANTNATNLLNALRGGYAGSMEDINDEIIDLAALITVLQGDVTTIGTDLDAVKLDVAANKTAIELQQSILDKYLLVAGDDNVVDAIAAIQEELAKAATKADLDAVSERIDAIDATLNILDFAKINNMITEVSFDFVYDDYERYRWLEYSTTTEVVDFVFSDGINKPITFKKGQRLASQPKKILVKVSPANADLSKMTDKISLIRGDNNTKINDYLTVVKAERANPLLTRATPTVNGLWYVSFELSQTADLKDLAKLTSGKGVYLEEGVEFDNDGHYLYAMAIENTVDVAEDAEARFIISDFVISIDASEDFTRAKVLDFMVDETKVSEINNRAANGSLSLSQDGITYKELEWDGNAETTQTATNVKEADDRSKKAVYPAVQGTPMKIKLTGDVESIRAIYVTLDYKANAIESAPSEWNAWQSYSYTGLGTVVEGTETEIVINNNSAINDMIGFRVFAVNFDGTLVDPDGKAFYVSLGVDGENWNTVNTVITPENETVAGIVSESVDKTLTEVTGATSYVWTTDKDENDATPAFHAVFEDKDGDIFSTNGGIVAGVDFEDVVAIHTVPTATNWLAYEDNKVYNGTLIIKNGTGHVIATIKVSMKKVLPTGAPSGFSVKTGQLSSDGVYRGYLIPTQGGTVANWVAPNATHGSMELDQIFNFTGAALTSVANFDVVYANANRVNPTTIGDLTVNPGNTTLVVAKEFIDNTTQHETSVVYNYGEISTEVAAGVDYVVEVANFPTIFSNIYNNTYSWSWPTTFDNNIVYGTTTTIPLTNVLGTSTKDSKYNAPLSAPYLNSLSINGLGTDVGGAKLYSNGTEIEEYFTATISGAGVVLTEASGSSNPTVDVNSTLVITVYDMYGHEVEIKLPIKVLKR